MLASHPSIAIPDFGTNYWTLFHNRFGNLRNSSNAMRAAKVVMDYDRTRMLGIDLVKMKEEFLAGPLEYGRLFALPLEQYARNAGKARWGAQSGMVEAYADVLFASYPNARMIHMIRDPRDRFAAARHRANAGRGGVGPAAARWLHSVQLADRNARRYPNQYMTIRYEDLVENPEQTIRAVCEFLGEEFHPRMLDLADAPLRRARILNRGRQSRTEIITPEFIGSFRGRIAPIELAYLQRIAGPAMVDHGYPLEPLELTVSERVRLVAIWPGQRARAALWNARTSLYRTPMIKRLRSSKPQRMPVPFSSTRGS
jgi:hypothetical protein